MQLMIDSLFGSTSNLALGVLITSGIGIVLIGSVLISKLGGRRRKK